MFNPVNSSYWQFYMLIPKRALKAAKLLVEYQKSGVSDPEGPFENVFTGMKQTDNSLCRELRGLRCILDKVSRKEHLTERITSPLQPAKN